MSNRDNVAVSLEGESKSMCQDIPREWCCHPAVIPEAVINRAVRVVAYQQETRYAVGKHEIRRGNNAAGANDPRYTRGVGRNDKSARAVKGEPRSLAVDTETCNKTAIRSVEGRYAAGADQGVETLLPNGKRNPAAGIMLALLAEIARNESETLRDRIKSGLALARNRGVVLGRRKGTTLSRDEFLQKHKDIIRQLKARQSLRNTAKIVGKGISTVQRVKIALAA